jgi:intergrase/recombinase
LSTNQDLAHEWARHSNSFNAYLGFKSIAEDTKRDYRNALVRFFEGQRVYKPQDFRAITLKDKEMRGLRNFFNYFEDEDIDEVLGYSIGKWRKYIKIKQSGVTEIYVTDEEIKEALDTCNDDIKTLFKLVAYSGSRLTHLYEMVQCFNEQNVITDGDVAHYPTSHLSKGTKKSFHIFLPSSFIPELKKMKLEKAYKTLTKDLQCGRVSVKTVRKWHLNAMISEGVSESVADFIQGRAPATVGSAHYLNRVKQAKVEYQKIIPRFEDIL